MLAADRQAEVESDLSELGRQTKALRSATSFRQAARQVLWGLGSLDATIDSSLYPDACDARDLFL